MDISKAKKLVELSKENRKILVTLWEGDKISSCVEDSAQDKKKSYCETCEGSEELCNGFVDYLKSRGYEATEIEVSELQIEDSLPKFLERPKKAQELKQPEELFLSEEGLLAEEGLQDEDDNT